MKKIIATLIIALCVAGTAMAQDELSFERKQAIDSLALEKVRDLSKYVKIVGSKDTPFSEANRVIDRAEELFMSDAEIGVSSVSSNQITYYRVRKYFEHLMRLNYDRVEIEWYNIEYVSDLQRQPSVAMIRKVTWCIKTPPRKTLPCMYVAKRLRLEAAPSVSGMCCSETCV